MNKYLDRNNFIDIDFWGLVGIRFENISVKDLNSIASSYSSFTSSLDREPDIIVRFVNEIKTTNLVFLGQDLAAYDEKNFYLFNDSLERKKVVIPFEKIGQKLEIICEKGIDSIPLLNHIINFYFIKKDYIPVHSSALYYNDKGILAMGWTKGGKTETLLSFANHAAKYVGDEWVVLSTDGSEMFGLNEPVTIWQWQLPYISKLINSVGFTNKLIFMFADFLEFVDRLGVRLKLNKMFPFNLLGENMHCFRKLLRIRKSPKDLFRNQTRNEKTKIDRIVLAMSYTGNDTKVEECNASEVINRMIHSNDTEQLPFFEAYKKFKYAFPEKTNDFLDGIQSKHSSLLEKAMSNKKPYKIIHPYPVEFEKLFNSLSKVLTSLIVIATLGRFHWMFFASMNSCLFLTL